MLSITPEVRDAMFAHALSVAPQEACGMFSAPNSLDLVDIFHPVTNAAASETIFELDAQEMLDVERTVDDAGRRLVGVMHSHPQTSAYPSSTDVRDISRFDPSGTFCHVIVSLRHAEPVLRCYSIREEVITEVPVVVTTGDDALGDGSGTAIAAVMRLPPP